MKARVERLITRSRIRQGQPVATSIEDSRLQDGYFCEKIHSMKSRRKTSYSDVIHGQLCSFLSRHRMQNGVNDGLLQVVCGGCLKILTFCLMMTLPVGDLSAEDTTLPISASRTADDGSVAAPTQRRLRAEGFAASLGPEVELELWWAVRAPRYLHPPYPSLTDLRLVGRVVTGPAVRPLVRLHYADDARPHDVVRLEQCFRKPLIVELGQLPCSAHWSGCWQDLGATSARPGWPLFPLQLALFLEHAGYVVKIDGQWLGPIRAVLQTGNLAAPPPPIGPQDFAVPVADPTRLPWRPARGWGFLPCQPAEP